jgi:hypothetical protein
MVKPHPVVRIALYPGTQNIITLPKGFLQIFSEGFSLFSFQGGEKVEIVMRTSLATHNKERHHPGISLIDHFHRPRRGACGNTQKRNNDPLVPGILIEKHPEKFPCFEALHRAPEVEAFSQKANPRTLPKGGDEFGDNIMPLACPYGIDGIPHLGETRRRKLPVAEVSGEKYHPPAFLKGLPEMGFSVNVNILAERTPHHRKPQEFRSSPSKVSIGSAHDPPGKRNPHPENLHTSGFRRIHMRSIHRPKQESHPSPQSDSPGMGEQKDNFLKKS